MKTHFITGAGSGIGAALATRLADRGDRLILLARNSTRAHDLARSFPLADVRVGDLADASTLVDAVAQCPPLDSLQHCAGVVELAPVSNLRLADLEEQMTVNLIAPAVLTQALLPAVRERGGTVIFVNSSAGLTASAEWGAYAASKFGLRGFADALRAEEIDSGVRVTTVFPSRTATPMQEKVHAQEGKVYDASKWIQPDVVVDVMLHVLDLPAGVTIPDVTVRPTTPRPGT